MDGKMKDSIRFQTLNIDKIDDHKIGSMVTNEWRKSSQDRNEWLQKREEYTANWRDLNKQDAQGPWENSSNFNVPLTLYTGKAIHARLWQIFADQNSFFGVKARKEVFVDREAEIQQFMRFILNDYANGKTGTRDTFDEVLWDNVFDGSGFIKVYWQRDEHKYLEVVPQTKVTEKQIFNIENPTGRTELEVTQTEEEQIKIDVIETPQIRRCMIEDVIMPPGQSDPQTADYVIHRIFMTSDQLKARAREGKFDEHEVKECLTHKSAYMNGDQDTEIKRQRMAQEGIGDYDGYYNDYHVVLERYGKIYVKKKIEGDEDENYEEYPEEAVVWVHQATGQVLGWTYLFRISPSGIRPLFKMDFIKFPDRNHGVGVAEVLHSTQQSLNAVYNLRQDNGMLASTPFGFYRASAGLKPDKYRIEPGVMIPTDNPQNDVRIVQMPFLQGFGYQEEDRLTAYAERTLSISDLQIRGQSDKVGLFRTASGASAVQQESGIQLEIHFDRIARTMSKMLQCLFRLCRERMPSELYYRVTGEDGRPIFGKVDRDSLRAEVDFEINIDVLSQGRIEQQQSATLLMQTLLNPAFMQTGIVTPDNLYHMSKNFLIKNRVQRPDLYVSEPQGYQGEPVRPEERIFRIVVGQYANPPVEDTVRLQDNHERAIQIYEAFRESDQFGLLSNNEQLQAFERLIQKHTQMLQAAQAGGMPNMTGMQTPRDGMAPIEAAGPQGASQGTLGSEMGVPNGPVF